MLGRFVKVRVTRPIGFFDGNSKTQYRLNYGTVESGLEPHSPVKGAFIMGINHPVRNFDGRVIATVKIPKTKGVIIVVSPKSKRFIAKEDFCLSKTSAAQIGASPKAMSKRARATRIPQDARSLRKPGFI